jgi:hypothetical protein
LADGSEVIETEDSEGELTEAETTTNPPYVKPHKQHFPDGSYRTLY